jgi:archaellin
MKYTKLLVAAVAASFALSGAAMAQTTATAVSTGGSGNVSQSTVCVNGVCTTSSAPISIVCKNNVCTILPSGKTFILPTKPKFPPIKR